MSAPIRFPFATPPEPGQAVEVAPDVLWLRLPLPMTLDHVNVYALADADGWTLVDTGVDARITRAAWAEALAGPLAGRRVARVLVTHHHPDHVGLAGWFQAQGAELLIPRTAWLYARMLRLDVQPRPEPELLAHWRGAGMDPDLLARRAAERPYNFADFVAPLPPGFTRIAEGQVLRLAGRRWQLRMGDGHAPEQATLWSLDDLLVIGADQLLPGISANIGVHATEPGADPLAEWLVSCRRFQTLARPDHLVLPGHKLPYTGLPHRLTRMVAEHLDALDRLRAHLAARPCTAVETFPVLFSRPIGEGDYSLALVEALAHLNHLLHRGEVMRESRDGVWWWHAAPVRGDDSGRAIG